MQGGNTVVRRLLAAFAALALLGLNAAQAAGANEAATLFESKLVGSTPGAAIGGVLSGGVPWVVRGGEVSLAANGMLHVEVKGLVLAPATPNIGGTTGPVTMVAASLVCNGSGGTLVASTSAMPLSPGGNAEIRQTITLPSSCLAPVVLVRVFNSLAPVGNQLGVFIAANGFSLQ